MDLMYELGGTMEIQKQLGYRKTVCDQEQPEYFAKRSLLDFLF